MLLSSLWEGGSALTGEGAERSGARLGRKLRCESGPSASTCPVCSLLGPGTQESPNLSSILYTKGSGLKFYKGGTSIKRPDPSVSPLVIS